MPNDQEGTAVPQFLTEMFTCLQVWYGVEMEVT